MSKRNTRVFAAFNLMAAAAMLTGLAFFGASSAQAATVTDLFKYLPADAQIAVGIPDIAAVETAGAPLLKLPALSQISSLAGSLGGDTLAAGLANAGVNASAPGAVFLQSGAGSDVLFSGVLLLDDADKAVAALTGLLGGEGAEVALPGDIKGRFVAGNGVGYFVNEGKLFVASTEALLGQLADRIAAPAQVNYGVEGPKDEVVAWSRIDIIEGQDLLSKIEALAFLKPILTTLKPFSDEVIFAIGEDAGQAYLRLAAHDSSGAAVASPGSLALHGFMDADAPVLMNLRITPELINSVSMVLMNNESTRQAGSYMRIASGLLGDEIAVNFKGMESDKIPNALIAATLKQAEAVPNLLKMVAKIEAPEYQHENANVYVYKNVAEGTDLHIAVAGTTVVVAPGDVKLKAALDSFSKGEAGSGAPKSVVDRGVYGFIVLDGAKAKDVPAGVVPASIDLSKVNIALTLGIDGAWREAVLTSPAGFSSLADLLKNVM